VFLTLASLGLTLVPQVSSQPENIKVLSYGWYVDSIGYLDVVGEVQNVGPNTIDSVVLSGVIYTLDGDAVSYSYPTPVYVKYLVPQQKAPFYMEFPPEVSVTGDLSWLSLGIDVDFTINSAEATSSYQYPDLTVTSSSGGADSEGVYWVSGTVQNTGTETATNIYVVGTFYNATGTVIAMGYTDTLTPASLSPSSTASFKVGAFDLNQSIVPSNLKIDHYSLLIQVEEPILTGAAPTLPTSTPPSTSPPSTTPPSDSTPSPTDENPDVLAPEAIYAIIIVIVILGLAITLLALRKTKSQEKSTKKSRKLQKRKKRK
jgi:hypothetical protein